MTNDALAKTMQLMTLILAGIQVSQTLKGATGEQKKDAVKAFVKMGEMGVDVFKPGVLNHPAVEDATDHVIEAIVALTHAHAKQTPVK